MLQDPSRKLLQIDDSATTVTAAPLSAANATSNISSSLLAPPSSDNKPHSILSDVISSFRSKYGRSPATAPAAAANATATAVITTDENGDVTISSEPTDTTTDESGDVASNEPTDTMQDAMDDASDAMEFYMEPCSDGPVPSAYESFVQVSIYRLHAFETAFTVYAICPLTVCLQLCTMCTYSLQNADLSTNLVLVAFQHLWQTLCLLLEHTNYLYLSSRLPPCRPCLQLYLKTLGLVTVSSCSS